MSFSTNALGLICAWQIGKSATFHFLMKNVNFAHPIGKFELFLGNNTSQKFSNQTSNFPVIQVLILKIMTPLIKTTDNFKLFLIS